MKTLEEMARDLFIRFGERETGVRPDWQYLNKKRKEDWQREVLEIADEILLALKDTVKPFPPGNNSYNTSYQNGYAEGIKVERTNLITKIDDIHNDLLEQLEDSVVYDK